MRIFSEPNTSHGWKCPICGTAEKKQVVLIGISGTEDGGNMEAEQVHFDCLELQIFTTPGGERVIAQVI